MKKNFSTVIPAVIVMLFVTVAFSACGSAHGEEYVIQYSDDFGTYRLTVKVGEPYFIEVLPSRFGYEFLGLYDSEEGGTKYVSATGASLKPYGENRSIILFPQYKPKEYTVVLEYGEAEIVGERSLTVNYGAPLSELPIGLRLPHKEFSGWYTEADCGGICVCDAKGNIPGNSVFNEKNFDLSEQIVYLYAGFELEKIPVTFYYLYDGASENLEIDYGTPINRIVTDKRIGGRAVLTWSKTPDGEPWSGDITEPIKLYALEFAPVIEFDSVGGDKVIPIVARAGDSVQLAVPTKKAFEFYYWAYSDGTKCNLTVMPEEGAKLKAVWMPKIEFDSNGGSQVDSIAKIAGEEISLPVPTKEGYIFAGWYTVKKEKFNGTIMPSSGIKLKAGWYKELSATENIIDTETGYVDYGPKFGNSVNVEWDISKYVIVSDARVKMNCHVKLAQKFKYTQAMTMAIDVYKEKEISDANFLYRQEFDGVTDKYHDYDFSIDLAYSGKLYIVFWLEGAYPDFSKYFVKDFYCEIKYPDTSALFL